MDTGVDTAKRCRRQGGLPGCQPEPTQQAGSPEAQEPRSPEAEKLISDGKPRSGLGGAGGPVKLDYSSNFRGQVHWQNGGCQPTGSE